MKVYITCKDLIVDNIKKFVKFSTVKNMFNYKFKYILNSKFEDMLNCKFN